MEINGLGHVHGAQSIRAPHRIHSVQPQTSTDHIQGADQLDISPEADMVSRVHDMADVRADRIAQIRAEIESGVYETDQKLDVAVGRLLDEIG